MSQANSYEVIKVLQTSIESVRQREPDWYHVSEMKFSYMDGTYYNLSYSFTTYITADR